MHAKEHTVADADGSVRLCLQHHLNTILSLGLWKLQTGRVGRGRVVYSAGVVDVVETAPGFRM